MQTEETFQTAQIQLPVVSVALQDVVPPAIALLDAGNKPVRLSSAGYVLRAGEKYRLRVALPADPSFESVRLNTSPEFLKMGEAADHMEDSRRFREFPFRVERGLKSMSVVCETLEVEVLYRPGRGMPPFRQDVPFVVRPGWG